VLTLVGDKEAALKSLHNYHQAHFIFGVLTLVGDTEVVPKTRISTTITSYTSYPGMLTLVGDTEAVFKSLHNYQQVHFISWCAHPCGRCRDRAQESP